MLLIPARYLYMSDNRDAEQVPRHLHWASTFWDYRAASSWGVQFTDTTYSELELTEQGLLSLGFLIKNPGTRECDGDCGPGRVMIDEPW